MIDESILNIHSLQSPLVNDLIITQKNVLQYQFDRDNCFITVKLNNSTKGIEIELFYCLGGASSDGSNKNIRGNGNGKKLMLDSLKFLQTNHPEFESITLHAVAKLDPKYINNIYKEEIDKYLAENENHHFQNLLSPINYDILIEEVENDYNEKFERLNQKINNRIITYKGNQQERLNSYYEKLGFHNNNSISYISNSFIGERDEIIERIETLISNEIKSTTSRGKNKNSKNKRIKSKNKRSKSKNKRSKGKNKMSKKNK